MSAGFDPVDYVPTLQRLTMLAQLLEDEPIAELLAYANRIDSIGPILHPTAYHRGMKNLDDHRKLLRALRGVQTAVEEIRESASTTPTRGHRCTTKS